MPTVDEIWEALKTVKDPEIPTISLVDLGVITAVILDEAGVPHVRMTPTFVGCPAMGFMQQQVRERLLELGFPTSDVRMTFEEEWNTNKITEEGLRALNQHGLAAPPRYEGVLELEVLNNTPCPYCRSHNTTLHSPFGPTLCRSLHYCNNCRQAFEGFKPL